MCFKSARSFAADSFTCLARRGPYFEIYSRITLLSSTGTGLRSLANASAPTRCASNGIAPPPAKGSATSGEVSRLPPSDWCAMLVSTRLVLMNSLTVEFSQFANSAIKSRSAYRSSKLFSSLRGSRRSSKNLSALGPLNSFMWSFAQTCICDLAAIRKESGHSESAGSGQSAAQITARQAAKGRLAHQMCKVEICPNFVFFSRRACSEIRLIGRSTSISRLGKAEVISTHRQ